MDRIVKAKMNYSSTRCTLNYTALPATRNLTAKKWQRCRFLAI